MIRNRCTKVSPLVKSYLTTRRSSSSDITFKDKVAIVTGAGGGIGRQYALEFAKRGAKVLVNDTGSTVNGLSETGSNAAASLVNEIEGFGGIAVSDSNSVLDGEKIVQAAINAFGKCDVLINNAGILRDKSFAKLTQSEWQAVLDVHLNGTFSMCHAAWQHMVANQYGRVVNIGSGAGLYGNFGQANYSAAKMGILGLTNTLAIEGVKYNIKVNCVVPVAATRMTESLLPASLLPLLDASHVVPIVSYLASEQAVESGCCFEVGGGWYSQVRLQRSKGAHLGSSAAPARAEDIAQSMRLIGDFNTDATYPTSPTDAIKSVMNTTTSRGGLPPVAKVEHPPPSPVAEGGTNAQDAQLLQSGFKSDWLFHTLKKIIDTDPEKAAELVQLVGAVVYFEVSASESSHPPTPPSRRWLLDLRSHCPPCLSQLAPPPSSDTGAARPEVSIQCSDDTLLSLAAGKTSAEGAFLRGQLKVKGRMAVALQVKALLALASKNRGQIGT